MHKTVPTLLSLLLIGAAVHATPQYDEYRGPEFSVDELKFNLDWDDQQFGWSQSDCLDLVMGDAIPSDCKDIRINLDDDEKRNHPPATNQGAAEQSGTP